MIVIEDTVRPGSLPHPLVSGLLHALVGVGAQLLLVLVDVVESLIFNGNIAHADPFLEKPS